MIKDRIQASAQLKIELSQDPKFIDQLEHIANLISEAFEEGNKVLFCGNGGSAADAQHLAAELSGRFYYDRPPLPAEAMHVNTSYLTAVANDYSYDQIYARYLESTAIQGDIVIGLSTSGQSENIVRSFETAKKLGVTTIGLTGQGGGKMKAVSDHLIEIPSTDTPRIQECHMLVGHILCEWVEKRLFPQDKV